MVHRLGRMLVGETSVAVIVTAPHRRPAFEAALEGINRLKKVVPIWKKEHFVDGEVWVEGEWDANVPVAWLSIRRRVFFRKARRVSIGVLVCRAIGRGWLGRSFAPTCGMCISSRR